MSTVINSRGHVVDAKRSAAARARAAMRTPAEKAAIAAKARMTRAMRSGRGLVPNPVQRTGQGAKLDYLKRAGLAVARSPQAKQLAQFAARKAQAEAERRATAYLGGMPRRSRARAGGLSMASIRRGVSQAAKSQAGRQMVAAARPHVERLAMQAAQKAADEAMRRMGGVPRRSRARLGYGISLPGR